MTNRLLLLSTLLLSFYGHSQCDSLNVPGDLIVQSDVIMSGTYSISGTFKIEAGATVFVDGYANGACGELKIYADSIIVEGAIDGDFAGFPGGVGGTKGTTVSSLTGHQLSLNSCDDEGSQGKISVQYGFSGNDGSGPGAGLSGANGAEGSGPKQYCGNVGDEAGVIGGAGGAGGGAGGSYGGLGGDASNGGNGSGAALPNNMDVETSYPIVGGNGGAGGLASTNYGTEFGRDIDLGSGGAGAGGGGRSYYEGNNGANGGNGGGMIWLQAQSDLTISGTISAKGADGGNGGFGGNGDATADCCSDGCNGCDERTFSTGAGSGAGGGGGSGGGIFIESLGDVEITGTLIASGGNPGAGGLQGVGVTCNYDGGFVCGSHSITTGDGTTGGQGGAGSGGRIKVFVLDCQNAVLNPTVQINGGAGAASSATGTYQEICNYASITEAQKSIGWKIYPNPTNDFFFVEIYDEVNEDIQVDLINQFGQKVNGIHLDSSGKVNVANVSPGLYFVQLSGNDFQEIKKIIIR